MKLELVAFSHNIYIYVYIRSIHIEFIKSLSSINTKCINRILYLNYHY